MVENPTLIAILAVLVACGALAALAIVLYRARRPARREEDEMAALARQQTDAAARLEGMIKLLANGQSQLQRAVNDRLDSVSSRLGDSMEKTKQNTAENLQKLNERLAVIDRAQKNITELATQVTSLQSVLANKQSRGAFGQGQMEAIIQDGLPKGAYAFQQSLSNRTRPDCCVFLPDRRPLVIDAKFPLEAVTAHREAKSDDERKAAAQRLRTDVAKHVSDIAGKYLIPGETQELAFMFVPSESVYAELHDGFDDIVQKAFRAKVVIVSPSLLMIAIHVIRQIQKDARMREAAGEIRDEVGHLMKDVGLLGERVRKLQAHFTQSNEDIRQALISVDKIEARGERIREVELGEAAPGANMIAGQVRRLEAGE
ncbi:MAG TPA: DNA recombination protein RmuC [Stellaceae bacterium]|jgi:DNA recombination protein RmuC|nr:DNA recombination protein RmuC [Stellaceae bacterium]